MNTSKKTMLAAALAVAVVALAGVGYALSYTATTTNGGNSLDAKYVTLSQDATAFSANILTSIYYDTVQDTASAYKYYPVSDYALNDAGTVYTHLTTGHSHAGYALISEPISLTVDNSHSTSATSGTFVVTATGFDVGDLTITMVLGQKDTTTGDITIAGGKAVPMSETGVWNFGELAFSSAPQTGTNTYTWEVFILASGYSSTAISSITSASFEFVLTMPDS